MSYNELRRNLDTYSDVAAESHDGEDYCENCCDWTGDTDGRCDACGLRYQDQRDFLDNTTYADMLDLLPF